MILVVGATGTTGGAVVRALLDRGAPVRGLTRSEHRAEELRALGAEAAVGDLDDPLSLMRALRGVERMFLMTPCGEQAAVREADAVAAAEQAGVYHCVTLGSAEALLQSSVRWTVVEPGGADPSEVAAAAARALTEEGHENTTYRVAEDRRDA